MSAAASALPIVLVPVGVDEDALDACLAALDAGTPAGTRVWLADDAQAGPRGTAIIEGWLKHTSLQAAHTRRASPIGEAAHLDEALRASGDADVAILSGDARPAPGWLQQLSACFARSMKSSALALTSSSMVSMRLRVNGPVSVMRPSAKLWITPRGPNFFLNSGFFG